MLSECMQNHALLLFQQSEEGLQKQAAMELGLGIYSNFLWTVDYF